MRLKRLNEECPWAAYAELDELGECSLEHAIAALAADPKTSGYAAGFAALLQLIPPNGPRQLGTKLYHYVDEENEIYEFTKGPFRLLCFQAEGRLVICSHLFRKTSRKVPKAEVARAVAVRHRYLAAVAAGSVVYFEE